MGLDITPLIVVKEPHLPHSSILPAGPGYLVNVGDYFLYPIIWVFPKIGVPPKWMVYNGKPY